MNLAQLIGFMATAAEDLLFTNKDHNTLALKHGLLSNTIPSTGSLL